MKKPLCQKCGALLTQDDIGCSKKLINRGCTEFSCVKCLAGHLGVTEELLREKMKDWKRQGCSLFQ